MRDPEELLTAGLAVIDSAVAAGARSMAPLLSGGHDSTCACHVASRHPLFDGRVHFIDTGIGARQNREHVESLCRSQGWELEVYKSWNTYKKYVVENGFPGPGRHGFIYNRIKDYCVRQIVWQRPKNGLIALVTGCRSQESVRRMGHVEPLKIGESGTKMREKWRAWTAPCHDWSVDDQREYMDHFDLPLNVLKKRLGVSGECFCGAFASPGELDRIRFFAPDVAERIDRLAEMARRSGKHDQWGTRPPGRKELVVAKTGPLCSGCDQKAAAAGIVIVRK